MRGARHVADCSTGSWLHQIGAPGFEPGTSATQRRRATRLRYAPRAASVAVAARRSDRPVRVRRPQQQRRARPPAAPRRSAGPCGRPRVASSRAPSAPVSAAIQIRFAAPTANITSISAQQHPTQNTPWRTPEREAAAPARAGSGGAGTRPGAGTRAGTRPSATRTGTRPPAAAPTGAIAQSCSSIHGLAADRGVHAGVERRTPARRTPTTPARTRPGTPPSSATAAALPADGGRVHPHQRQARRQHHRRHHHLPRDQEQQEGGPEAGPALQQRVVVQRAGGPGRLGRDRRDPGRPDPDQHRPTARRRAAGAAGTADGLRLTRPRRGSRSSTPTGSRCGPRTRTSSPARACPPRTAPPSRPTPAIPARSRRSSSAAS